MGQAFIHPTATVDHGAKIGDFTSIWHYSHIESSAIVGENCNLGQSTYVGVNGIVGNGCRLGNSVSIFSNVELQDFVFCGPFMVFTHINFPRAAVTRRRVFEQTLVKVGASLGANSTILPGVIVGSGAFIAAGTVLTRSCKDWALMMGTPARQVGWVSAFGERIPLPLVGCGSWECYRTGDRYSLVGDSLSREPGTIDLLKYDFGMKLERLSI